MAMYITGAIAAPHWLATDVTSGVRNSSFCVFLQLIIDTVVLREQILRISRWFSLNSAEDHS